jgi:hypothetical protein
MKKILFICDGENFSTGAMDLIRLMNENEPVFVKGFFFSPIDFQELTAVGYIPIAQPYARLKEKKKMQIRESEEKFIKECNSNNIKYHVYESEEWDKSLLIKETRFADVLLVSEELFCLDIFSYQPNAYMQEALRGSECPVIMVPEKLMSPERVVVAYDGKKQSLRALKQFCYLMPQFSGLPTEFVYIKNEENEDIPDEELLKEYIKCHFNSSSVSKLHFDAHAYFSTWTEEKKNMLLVSGSYSRPALSDLLRNSFAEQSIHDHKFPIFIAN